jgi:hypothetical protein
MSDNVKTFRRDWLKEAYKIAAGDQNIAPKKEHVRAAIDALATLAKDAGRLRDLMKQAYSEACRRRKEQGLPAPPKPPGLDNEEGFPWPTHS